MKVLIKRQSVKEIAIECGLIIDGILLNCKSYKENGHTIVEKRMTTHCGK